MHKLKLLVITLILHCNHCLAIHMPQEIVDYFNGIDIIAIDFEQIDSNENTSTGILLIKRPNHLRVNYDPPNPLVIVGNKDMVYIYDFDLETMSYAKPSQNALSALLNIGSTNVIEVQEHDEFYTLVIMYDQDNNDSYGEIDVSKKPVSIMEVRSYKNNAFDVAVRIKNIQNINKIDNEVFKVHGANIARIDRKGFRYILEN